MSQGGGFTLPLPPPGRPKWARSRVVPSFYGPLGASWPLFFEVVFSMFLFDRFLVGFASPNPPQIDPKSMKNRSPNPLLSWLRSLAVFSSIFTLKSHASNPPNVVPVLHWLQFKRLRPFRVHVRVGFAFGPILAPFWHQNWSKIHQNSDQERHSNFDRCFNHFFDHFSSILDSTFGPLGPLWPLKRCRPN